MLMNIPAVDFEQTHPAEVERMKVLFGKYIAGLRSKQAGTHTGTNIDSGEQNLTLKIDKDGYPVLPTPWHRNIANKVGAEKLYQTFINLHYSMFQRNWKYIATNNY